MAHTYVVGGPLSNHPDIDKLSFTGSLPTARKIMAAAALVRRALSLDTILLSHPCRCIYLTYKHTCIHTQSLSDLHSLKYTYTHANTHVHTYIHTHTISHSHTYIHTHTYTLIKVYIHIYTHMRAHTHTHSTHTMQLCTV